MGLYTYDRSSIGHTGYAGCLKGNQPRKLSIVLVTDWDLSQCDLFMDSENQVLVDDQGEKKPPDFARRSFVSFFHFFYIMNHSDSQLAN